MTIVNLNDYRRRPASEQLGVDNPPKPEVMKCLGCGWEDFKVLTNGVLICSHCARRPGALLPRMEDWNLLDP